MTKRHVLLTNWNLRNSTNLSRLFVCLFLNSYTRKRGNNRDINNLYNDNDHDFIIWQTPITQRPFLSEESAISMYNIFTCAINAEILWWADTKEVSFGVVAYGAAVTFVFSCCTLVYVCKTGGATIRFAFFLYSCFRPWKEYRETVFSNQFDDCRQNWFQSESWLSTDCCSKYSYNSVIGLCPSYIPK